MNETQGPTPGPIDYGEISYAQYASGSGSLVLVLSIWSYQDRTRVARLCDYQ